MTVPALVRLLVVCLALMVLSATSWLPRQIAIALGSGAFVVLILSTCAAALKAATRKNRTAEGFFGTGLFLLVIAYPCFRPVVSLFEAPQRFGYNSIPGEVVFGVLAVLCFARAGLIWTSDETATKASPPPTRAGGPQD